MIKKEKSFLPVMLTPFKDNGAVDFDGLTMLTEFYLEAGAGGLFANCQSSEMFALTEAERLAITSHVVKVANGAVPVVAAGTFGGKMQIQADFAKRIFETGIESVIIITNMLAGELETDAVFDDRVHQLLDLTDDIPMGFYECPVPYKRLLSAAQLKRFTDTGRINYHKDTCLDLDMVTAKIIATRNCADFGLYDAYIINAVDSLKAGAAGLSCIQGNYFPELISWICTNYDQASKSEELSLVHQFLAKNMELMHTVYPKVAKYFLQKRGLSINSFSRTFTGVFDDTTRDKLDNLDTEYMAIHELIGSKYTV